MKRFEILYHTGDALIKVVAPSIELLFSAALDGMNHIILSGKMKKNKQLTRVVEIYAPDKVSLLIDFLSEVLTLSQIESAIFCKFEILKLSDTHLKASLIGFKVSEFDQEIKAVTHHRANIIKNNQGNYETQIVFDI